MNRNNTVFLGILGWCYDCFSVSYNFSILVRVRWNEHDSMLRLSGSFFS
nr:MAG TPA: hypothetical protein [Caudoviricetes sp.]